MMGPLVSSSVWVMMFAMSGDLSAGYGPFELKKTYVTEEDCTGEASYVAQFFNENKVEKDNIVVWCEKRNG